MGNFLSLGESEEEPCREHRRYVAKNERADSFTTVASAAADPQSHNAAGHRSRTT